jgi:putative acetyltransferase
MNVAIDEERADGGEKLLARGVRFFVVRVDGEPVGCGGVEITGEHAELKRMFVLPSHRGRGLSRALIDKLEAVARTSGAHVLRLETGVHQTEALALYERTGFRRVPPFPPYPVDPLSVCMEKPLVSSRAQ